MILTYAENPSLCYQCGRCSAGCPLAPEMDILPHQMIRLTALGLEQEILDKKALWLCAGCSTCSVRCPNDIDIAAVLDHLRGRAVEMNIPCPLPDIRRFHDAFLQEALQWGRVNEARLMARFNLRVRRPFQNFDLLPGLLIRRRLKLSPSRKPRGFKPLKRKPRNEILNR